MGDQRGEVVVAVAAEGPVQLLVDLPLGQLPGGDPGEQLADGVPEVAC
ncbi:hypothetical protein AB0873_15015 [Micromonospora sp. NPDC047707]